MPTLCSPPIDLEHMCECTSSHGRECGQAGRGPAGSRMLGGMTPCAMSRGAAMMRAMTDVSV